MKHENVISFTRCAQKSGTDDERKNTADLDWQVIQNQMDIFSNDGPPDTQPGQWFGKITKRIFILDGIRFLLRVLFFIRGKNLNRRVVWWTFSFLPSLSVSRSLVLAKWSTLFSPLFPNGSHSKRPFTIFSDTVFFLPYPESNFVSNFSHSPLTDFEKWLVLINTYSLYTLSLSLHLSLYCWCMQQDWMLALIMWREKSPRSVGGSDDGGDGCWWWC